MPDILTDLDARRPAPKHPEGWEPGIAWDGRQGTITSRPLAEPTPDWDALLRVWGFDPAVCEIVEPVQVRTWDAAIGDGQVRTMWYYRASIRQRPSGAVGIDELLRLVKRRKATPTKGDGPGAYFLALNDWQAGKKGTAGTVERIMAASIASVARIRELRRLGREIDTIVLAGIGDLVEQCDGHYPNQRFEVELDMRSQRRLVRRLILAIIDDHRSLAKRIIVPCAAGNHGEARVDGKQVTGFADNSDLEVFESVAEALSQNPAAYGHVSFVIPNEQLTVTLQPVPGGPIVAIAHGHQAKKGGGSPQQKVATWVAGQAYGFRPVGDASIIVVGHYHQFAVNENGGRTVFIAPTIDSGSQWYAETAGTDSTPGMLSFLIRPTGWSDVQVL